MPLGEQRTEHGKPFNGYIDKWRVEPCNAGLGYRIAGLFLSHPEHAGKEGMTSFVIAFNQTTLEIETKNSRYRLCFGAGRGS